MKNIGAATALEVRSTGINYVFAPCIAVCYQITEQFSEVVYFFCSSWIDVHLLLMITNSY